jgi:glucosamine-6-phosphate deaminase
MRRTSNRRSHTMEVVILPDADAIGRLAADIVEAALRQADRPVIGLATGSSPLTTYGELVRRHRVNGLSFAHATTFLLDEYVGLPPNHPQRYRAVIEQELTGSVNIPAAAIQAPDGNAADIPRECANYEAAIVEAGGIDLQLLGIGSDGHLAFNEPGSSLASRTRIKTLTNRTRQDNARFFGSLDEVPQHVITQGLATILAARHLLLLASSHTKATAILDAIEGPVTASCPASILQLHPHATVLLDASAASRLANADHYRATYALKPKWQPL